jgi:hypothetical protein
MTSKCDLGREPIHGLCHGHDLELPLILENEHVPNLCVMEVRNGRETVRGQETKLTQCDRGLPWFDNLKRLK